MDAVRRLPALLAGGRFEHTFDGMPVRIHGLTWRKRLNLLICGLDAVTRREKVRGLPPAIQIEPTNICNLTCPLCPTGTGNATRRKGMLSLDTFNAVMDQLGDTLVSVVLYGWGEPFLNADLLPMIRACTERGIATITSTNGHCLQSEVECLALVDAGLSALVIALDGSTQEVYEAYRKCGKAARVLTCVRNIEYAKRRRGSPFPYTNIRAVVTSANEHDLPNLRALATEEGVNMFSFKSVGDLAQCSAYETFEASSETMKRYGDGDGQRRNTQRTGCPYPFRQPTLFWDGTLVGCEFDYGPDLPLGHARAGALPRAWNSESARRLRRLMRTSDQRPAFCDRCPYQNRVGDSCVLACEELRPLPPAAAVRRGKADKP